jgi:hypothetical protein
MAFTTGQAGGGQVQQLATPTAYAGDAQELARSQRLAQLLSGQQMPEGQMVSGRFVAPSWTQQLAGLVNAGTGAYFADQAEKQNLALAKKIREGENAALADYMAEVEGRPAVPEQKIEMAGPYGQSGGGANIPMPQGTIAGRAAIPANPRAANLNAAQNDMLPSWMRQFAMKEVTKGPDWKEISQYNDRTGNTETYRYNANADDPRKTMQFLGVSKPAISPSDRLNFADKGIAIPSNFGGGGGGSMPVAGNPVAGGQVNPQATIVKPVSATSVKEPDLVKAFGYDPFKPPPPPAGMPSAEAAREYKKDQYKPLEEGKAKKVNGAAYYQDALDKYVEVINSVDLKDLANPQVRNRIDSAYNTAMLTGKNAFDLGVLNGGDERILNSLLPNYKDVSQLLVTKQTIKELAQAQKEYGTGVILKEYGSANKPVPEMYRKHIVVPKSVTPDVPAKKGGIPAGIDPAIWAVMTPQEKSLWQ